MFQIPNAGTVRMGPEITPNWTALHTKVVNQKNEQVGDKTIKLLIIMKRQFENHSLFCSDFESYGLH